MSLNTNQHNIITLQEPVSSDLERSKIHPVLKRVLANRGIDSVTEIDYSLKALEPWHKMKDIERAASIVINAMSTRNKILIVGDFDADGATSTAVVIRALNLFGYTNIDHLVPNRFDYGYGLSPELANVVLDYSPGMVITVDNGISSIEGIKRCRENNIDVVVTDHHLPGNVLPQANAIVNPNQPGCTFTSKSIAGVGVAFYLMLAVRAGLMKLNWFEEGSYPNMACLLDLVALGTVADVVPLDRNNRILVAQGLERIRSGKCSNGITALLQVSGRNQARCSSADLGFFVAPRLNAAGRLESMSEGIACLLTEDCGNALSIAENLHVLNSKRREIEQNMLEEALSQMTEIMQTIENQTIPSSICLYNDQWHQGVIGILASRIKETYHRPVIAFAKEGDGLIKGSARSIQGLHIRDCLDRIARKSPGLITKFGGHAMAAGLTMRESGLDQFTDLFETEVTEILDAEQLERVCVSDGRLEADFMTLETAEIIKYSQPWGQAYHEPLFDDVFRVLSLRVVGEKHLKMKLEHKDGIREIDAIAFNTTGNLIQEGDSVRVVYRLDVNEFRNLRQFQMIVEYIEPVIEDSIDV